ncbi:MAG TPA: phosphonate C-P lyase system protein PhnH [Candidatus Acidoferrales bacterium]|nr:phosphonate C-P lyase system protein PhnH [Candidatus Acidoferrales bacterium]
MAPVAERELLLHTAFRTVLTAMAYPGRTQVGPVAGEPDAGHTTVALITASLLESSDDTHNVVFAKGDPSAQMIARLSPGTEEIPEDGATLIIVDATACTAARLSGPGIREAFATELPLTRAALEARNLACADYPLGVDLIFVHADGRVSALPRTTHVEVLT